MCGIAVQKGEGAATDGSISHKTIGLAASIACGLVCCAGVLLSSEPGAICCAGCVCALPKGPCWMAS